MSKKFSDLRAKMTLEAQQRVKEKAQTMRAELDSQEKKQLGLEFTLKKTLNLNYRVLVDGKVHPLLCGLEDAWSAKQRVKEVFGLQEDPEIVHHRFEVGHEYLFIAEKFIPKRQRFYSLYLPWEDQLVKIQAVVVRCISQHEVVGEWDDKIQYQGYKFEFVRSNIPFLNSEEPVVWHNQFPRAAYGQTTTDADYYVYPHVTDKETINRYMDSEIGSDRRGSFTRADIKIEALYRGVRQFSEHIEKVKSGKLKEEPDRTLADFERYKVGLETYIKELTEFATIQGFKTVTQPVYLRSADTGAKEVLEGFVDVELLPL